MPKITSACPLFVANWAFSQDPKLFDVTFLTPSLRAIEVTSSGAAPMILPSDAQATGGYAGCPVMTSDGHVESAAYPNRGTIQSSNSGTSSLFIVGSPWSVFWPAEYTPGRHAHAS